MRSKRKPIVLPEPDIPALKAALQARVDRIRAEGSRQDARKRSDAAKRGWQTRRARIAHTLSAVELIAERLRETATGLRNYLKPEGLPGSGVRVHPSHAANRLDLLADQLAARRTK